MKIPSENLLRGGEILGNKNVFGKQEMANAEERTKTTSDEHIARDNIWLGCIDNEKCGKTCSCIVK